ncbi:MAG TPA: VWA domain-containing protein [Thermoanaerobaculia bacterium]|nr:VWA domain-containing protein [Thermoanaerobaculia bacterium]
MKNTFSPWLAALACAFLAAAPVASQDQRPAQPPAQEPQPSLFGEQIEVRVVNVEVVATDRQGNRVADLKPSDFRLTVDGKPVQIEYFSEVRGGQAIAPTGGEAAQIAGLPTLAPGEPVGTSYLVFIDDFFTLQTRRDEVLRSLKETLFRLGPEDRMAVVAFDGRGLELLSSWSNSHRNLNRAFDKALSRRAVGAQRIAELRNYRLSRRISVREGFGPMPAFQDRLDDEELDYAVRLRDQVTRSVEAATSSLRGFANPPGRKVMLLLSGGWPFNITSYVVANPARPVYNRYEVPPGEKLIGPLVDTANRLGYTIYPVDVPGIESEGANADVIDVSLQVEDVNNQFPGTTALLREQEVHSALEFVAQETGGRALLNGERVTAFETASNDTRSYYWLGFTPSWQGNDSRHEIRVESLRSDVRVRSRKDYLDLSRKAEVSLMVESAMLFGAPPGTVPMPVQLGKPVPAGRREMDLPISLAIPVAGFQTLPVDGKHVAELELRIFALDGDGGRSDIPVVPIRISTKDLPEAGKHVRYDTKIRLRRTGQHLVVSVFDPLSGKISTAEVDVNPDKG